MPEDEAFVLNHIIECLTCVEYILGKPILLLRFLRPRPPIKQEHESLLEDESSGKRSKMVFGSTEKRVGSSRIVLE